MSVNKLQSGAACSGIMLVLIFFILVWWCALPRVHVYLPESARGELTYTLNVQNDIERGSISPGQMTGGTGHIFPNDEFFMQFEWTHEGRNYCVNILPQWPYTLIYLNAAGALDKTLGGGTDLERIEECKSL